MRRDDATTEFETHRPRLVRLAYRMLGSRASAEDMVQEAWLRWRQVDLDAVQDAGGYLSRIVTRLCLDEMKSARVRRESYVGQWLPEPLVDDLEEPVDSDDLTLTLMLALERLSPLERAAFLLHDVFGQPLHEIATALDRDAAAVRQLASRARKHVQAAKPRFPVAQDEGRRIAEAFFTATRAGDMTALTALLAEDVVIRSDGGGKVIAFRNPIVGIDRVLRLYAGLRRKFTDDDLEILRPVTVDGLPGYVTRERGLILQTTAFAIEDGRIVGIFITRNPDKLGHVRDMIAH
ncbi:MAG TPA: RNA polymerase sigma factor SigJ [Gemmatimonas aurantiaca]|uniref:RNA polymerase ECF-type sigma factor n=2 Tax=Gemmatimonas aurantiaca TaxID=173480 RepID=C1ABY8_GEMAT|nr:sigma-70 family RNA polymerase sigma factor [Gemmatimonas aurantiaca]BAH40015.1 RNA polymerase ECF-type sigma factor [Gemmatimonas aurantiaca T-27]HCT57977.1 RNA polymerase sigma factor SigJ [Gemmatimonas aurantiaca]